MSGERHGWSLGQVRLFLSEGVNNLHTFAIEKKAQRKRGMFNLKYTLSHVFSKTPELSLVLACLRSV
jgi:hypothetical protein